MGIMRHLLPGEQVSRHQMQCLRFQLFQEFNFAEHFLKVHAIDTIVCLFEIKAQNSSFECVPSFPM